MFEASELQDEEDAWMSWSAMAGSSCSLSGLRVLPSRARSFDGQVACRPRDGEKSSMTVQSVRSPFKSSALGEYYHQG
jgi:hypothetical protein